jgi:hypothetical protein
MLEQLQKFKETVCTVTNSKTSPSNPTKFLPLPKQLRRNYLPSMKQFSMLYSQQAERTTETTLVTTVRIPQATKKFPLAEEKAVCVAIIIPVKGELCKSYYHQLGTLSSVTAKKLLKTASLLCEVQLLHFK